MSDPTMRRHGLEPFLHERPQSTSVDCGVEISIHADAGHINLRGGAGNKDFVAAIENALEQTLPIDANTMSNAEHRVYWLGPDEWLIVTAADRAADIASRLGAETAAMHAAVNDLSGGQITLGLAGPRVRDLLAKGCTLDLHPDVFSPGDCAQTGLAKANVLLGLIDTGPTFELIVRRSFSDYLCRWLSDAGREYALSFLKA